MAKASKFTRRTIMRDAVFEDRTVRVKVSGVEYGKEEMVRLVLSVEEAEALRAVLMRIGGDGETTRRGLTSAVNTALHEAGVKWELGDGDDLGPRHRSMHFIPRTNLASRTNLTYDEGSRD